MRADRRADQESRSKRAQNISGFRVRSLRERPGMTLVEAASNSEV